MGNTMDNGMGWYEFSLRDGDSGWMRFTGPISLLVSSRTKSRTKLDEFFNSSGANASKLSVHFLQLHPASTPSPNALLNLARLFAPSHQVYLVPGSHRPILPPPNIIVDQPTVIVSSTAAAFPYSPLAPVLIPRAHDMWCTERFFTLTPSARESDWQACVWQLHLTGLKMLVVPNIKTQLAAATSPRISIDVRISVYWVRNPIELTLTECDIQENGGALSGRDMCSCD